MSVLPGTTVVFDSGAQRRALLICVGVSVVLHGLVLFRVPAFRVGTQTNGSRILTATFAKDLALPGKEASIEQPVPMGPDRPRELSQPVHEVKPEAPPPAPIRALPAAPAEIRLPAPARGYATSASTSSVTKTVDTAATAGAEMSAAPANARAATLSDAAETGLLQEYRQALMDAVNRYERYYPAQARERGWEGRVEIRIVIGANGVMKGATFKTSSRYPILDGRALDMVKKGVEYAQIPPLLRGREFTIDVPVLFRLENG